MQRRLGFDDGRPMRARLGRRARAGLAVALAGLRQPAATSATMARTAIQAVAMVSSLVDTQEEIVMEPRAEVRSSSRRHLFWAIPLAVIGLVGVVGIAVRCVCCPAPSLPANATARLDDEAGVCTDQGPVGEGAVRGRPGRRPAGRAAPDDRGPADVRQQRPGAVRDGAHARAQHVGVVGRSNNPAVDEKSYSDLYGTETPQQQNSRGQRDMRTAKETAEYVALNRLGFEAELTPGDVIIDELVCLDGQRGRTDVHRVRALRRGARPGRQVAEGRRHVVVGGR